MPDQLQHPAGKHRHDDQLTHSADSVPYTAEKSEPRHPVQESDRGAQDQTDAKHHKHVYPAQRQHDDRQIGDQLDIFDLPDLRGGSVVETDDEIDDRDNHRRRAADPDVGLELVRHGASLCRGRGDGRVGDKGQVVAEEGSADNQSGEHRQ